MAAQIIAFPLPEKITFRPLKISAGQVIDCYDHHRGPVFLAVNLLSKTPADLKEECGAAGGDKIPSLISEFEAMSRDFRALSEMLDSSAARLSAAHRGLV